MGIEHSSSVRKILERLRPSGIILSCYLMILFSIYLYAEYWLPFHSTRSPSE